MTCSTEHSPHILLLLFQVWDGEPALFERDADDEPVAFV